MRDKAIYIVSGPEGYFVRMAGGKVYYTSATKYARKFSTLKGATLWVKKLGQFTHRVELDSFGRLLYNKPKKGGGEVKRSYVAKRMISAQVALTVYEKLEKMAKDESTSKTAIIEQAINKLWEEKN